jgi:hypothetical protein
MKKVILITTLTLLFAFKNSFGGMTGAMNLNSFDVNPKTNGKIIVSSSSATTVTATIVLTRGYNALNNNSSDPVDFRYKIVYIKNGVETQLVAETQLTHNHFSPNMGVLSKDVSVVIPAGLVGGVVTIKHRNYVWSTTSGTSKWYPFDRPYYVETGFQTINPSSSITINSVNNVEVISFEPDHFHAPMGMEVGVFNYVYEVSYTNSSSISENDIYFEWVVEDQSHYSYPEKQFLVYPYGTSASTPLNGEKKITMEANDILDEFTSKVFVRAKSRSTGQYLSSQYILYVNGRAH